MEQTDRAAEALKKIRAERGLTLEEAAEACGVSKPMLSQMERGKSVPTITTLWKIATGLKVPLSAFFESGMPLQAVSPLAARPVLDEQGQMEAWTVFPFDPLSGNETFLIRFAPGCRHASSGHVPGTLEEILVLEGSVEIEAGSQRVILTENMAVRFAADQAHTYAAGPQGARVYNTICYR